MSRRQTIDLGEREQAALARGWGRPGRGRSARQSDRRRFLRGYEKDPREPAMLDGIPGAWERAQERNAQIDAGQGTPLAQL